MMIRPRRITNILTWAKRQAKIRIINPKVMSNHQHPFRWLITMVANVTLFAMILIIWQTLVHKKESISKMLNRSFMLTKVFWLYSSHLFLRLTNKHVCASRMIDAWDEEHICSSYIQPSFFAHECNPHDSSVIAHVPHVRQTIASTSLLYLALHCCCTKSLTANNVDVVIKIMREKDEEGQR